MDQGPFYKNGSSILNEYDPDSQPCETASKVLVKKTFLPLKASLSLLLLLPLLEESDDDFTLFLLLLSFSFLSAASSSLLLLLSELDSEDDED
jgi:hypothetical protein